MYHSSSNELGQCREVVRPSGCAAATLELVHRVEASRLPLGACGCWRRRNIWAGSTGSRPLTRLIQSSWVARMDNCKPTTCAHDTFLCSPVYESMEHTVLVIALGYTFFDYRPTLVRCSFANKCPATLIALTGPRGCRLCLGVPPHRDILQLLRVCDMSPGCLTLPFRCALLLTG